MCWRKFKNQREEYEVGALEIKFDVKVRDYLIEIEQYHGFEPADATKWIVS